MSHFHKHRYPYLIALVLLMVVSLGSSLASSIKPVSAAAGSIYLTPSSNSLLNGSSVTLSLRITPGTTVDGVEGTVNFNSSQLALTSFDTSSSAFTTQLSQSQTTSSVSFARGNLSSGVSTDSLIATLTFRAVVGSGTGTVSLSGANATSSGSYTNPSTGDASFSFTSPAVATCAAGQTGTPPNCVTPPTTTTGTGTSGTTTKNTGAGTTTSSASTSTNTATAVATPATDSTPTSTTKSATSAAPKITQDATTEYTKASVQITTDVPTTTYIKYGTTTRDLNYSTAESGLAKTHTVTLDDSLLSPGKTYYYSVVVKSSDGTVVSSAIHTVSTKGMTVQIAVKDADGQPLKNQEVTLHSTPVTVKTDASGLATFGDVAPGSHSLIYSVGSKKYAKPLTVASIVLAGSDGKQTTIHQAFAVTYNVRQPVPVLLYVGIAAIVVPVLGIVTISFVNLRHHTHKLVRTVAPGVFGSEAISVFANMHLMTALHHFVTNLTHEHVKKAPTVHGSAHAPAETTEHTFPSNFVQTTDEHSTKKNPAFARPVAVSSEKHPWQKP